MDAPATPDPAIELVPPPNADEEMETSPAAPESRMPTRKDASLKEFLIKMDDYAPIVGHGIPSADSHSMFQCSALQAFSDQVHRFLTLSRIII